MSVTLFSKLPKDIGLVLRPKPRRRGPATAASSPAALQPRSTLPTRPTSLEPSTPRRICSLRYRRRAAPAMTKISSFGSAPMMRRTAAGSARFLLLFCRTTAFPSLALTCEAQKGRRRFTPLHREWQKGRAWRGGVSLGGGGKAVCICGIPWISFASDGRGRSILTVTSGQDRPGQGGGQGRRRQCCGCRGQK